jgi:cation diffusion facilitator CzcD-associated flavoprotein CzcO
MELNYWTGTEFESGSYDEAEGRWSVVLRRADGSTRTMHPRHVVIATGVSGIPNVPDIPTLKNFTGTVLHSSRYSDGEEWKGKTALVIGTGNSGHDIAQDLHSSGAEVTLVQRSPTLITNIEPSAQLAYEIYNQGTLEDNDLIATSMPLVLAKRSHAMITEQSKKFDGELLDGLARIGFKLDYGEDNTGWQLFQRRLLGHGHARRDQAAAILRYRIIRRRGCPDEARRDAQSRSDRAGDWLQVAGTSGAQTVRR